MYGLGLQHETGQGVAPDRRLASDWYRRAARAGDALAAARLGKLEA
jgi:TPR repeat protein